jgi:hypothetical protein
VLLFTSEATTVIVAPPWPFKAAFLLLGGVNALYFEFVIARRPESLPARGLLPGSVVGQSKKLSLLGLSMAITSGILMFLSAPLHYYSNWAFDAKMALLLGALVIYAAFFIGIASRASAHPWLAKIAVCLSLLSWVAVCMAGRAIGFV